MIDYFSTYTWRTRLGRYIVQFSIAAGISFLPMKRKTIIHLKCNGPDYTYLGMNLFKLKSHKYLACDCCYIDVACKIYDVHNQNTFYVCMTFFADIMNNFVLYALYQNPIWRQCEFILFVFVYYNHIIWIPFSSHVGFYLERNIEWLPTSCWNKNC